MDEAPDVRTVKLTPPQVRALTTANTRLLIHQQRAELLEQHRQDVMLLLFEEHGIPKSANCAFDGDAGTLSYPLPPT